MTLLVHEIATEVYQTFTPSKNKQVSVVRPHLYIHNNPIGTLKVQICTADETVLGESDTINMSVITALPEYHGYVTFEVSAMLMANTPYRIKVVAGGGYSFSESAYVGVCNDYDSRIYEPDTEPTHPRFAALDFQIWTLSQK